MDLFALTPQEFEALAADPWKGWAFRHFAAELLDRAMPECVVLLLGGLAAIVLWSRWPGVAKRVLAGCLVSLVASLYQALRTWLWTVLDPDPASPLLRVRSQSVQVNETWLIFVARALGLWLLIWGVLYARRERQEDSPA